MIRSLKSLVRIAAATLTALALTACATPPASTGAPASTPYKGNAVWNIA